MINKFMVHMEGFSYPDRRAYVYVPNSFKKNPNLRYPVLYMFDGQNVFFDKDATYGKSWGMLNYLKKSKAQIIVAAIECNPLPNNERLSEYSPFDFDDPFFGPIKGLGQQTLKYFLKEFKPFIDENYPTLKDRKHTYVAGSSMGGLISYYFLFKANNVVSKAACLSPSFWVNPKGLVELISNKKFKDSVIYMDYGSKETRGRFGSMAYSSLWKITNGLKKARVDFTVREILNGEHNEASWEKQIPVFMSLLLKEN